MSDIQLISKQSKVATISVGALVVIRVNYGMSKCGYQSFTTCISFSPPLMILSAKVTREGREGEAPRDFPSMFAFKRPNILPPAEEETFHDIKIAGR